MCLSPLDTWSPTYEPSANWRPTSSVQQHIAPDVSSLYSECGATLAYRSNLTTPLIHTPAEASDVAGKGAGVALGSGSTPGSGDRACRTSILAARTNLRF